MCAKRQVILIMTDTQRPDMVGCYGNPAMRTPNLDALAAGGVRFDRAYTCQPVCGPARSALFTGTFPHTNGSWANCMPLGQTVRTIGQRVADAGIRTAYIGKWHLDGGDYFGLGRCPAGWDPADWYDMRNYLEELSPEDRVRSRDPSTNRANIPASFTFGHRCTNRARDFLARHAADDFLLVVSYDEPHHPFLCPEPFASMYRDFVFPKTGAYADTLADKPAHQRVWAGARLGESAQTRRAHVIRSPDILGCNSFIDHEIGRVVEAIDRHAPGALVIYTSDHGDFMNHRGLNGKGPAMYDDITRIPFIARWPGTTPAGSVCAHPVSHIDVVPTLLACYAIPPSRVLEGQNLAPCFADPTVRINEAIFMEFSRYEIDHDYFGGFQPIRCIMDGRHKLVINLLAGDELYDLETDPDELTNCIDSPAYASIRNRLHDRLLDWMGTTRDPFRGYYWCNRPWRLDAPAPTWDGAGHTRQREEDPRYEPRQLDYTTGLEMKRATRKISTS